MTIFTEDFDAISGVWNCEDNVPPGWWDSPPNCQSATYGGITHRTCEISSGGRVGNSYKVWRRSGFPTQRDFFSNLLYEIPGNHRNLFTRWYMKIPAEWEEIGFDYRKLWRMASTANGDTLYINFNCRRDNFDYVDVRWQNCVSLMVWPGAGGDGWYTLLNHDNLPRDGQWHSYEIQSQLDTTGNNNGVLRFWLDGTERSICLSNFSVDYNCTLGKTNVDYGVQTSDYWTRTGIGIGNRADPEGQQASWQAIEFDDFVLADSYIGPINSGQPDVTPPATPNGLTVS